MPIPAYQDLFAPLLEIAADEQVHSISGVSKILADQFQLSEQERLELIPSRKQTIFQNRITWAKNYFVKAGMLITQGRGKFKITRLGLQFHAEGFKQITLQILRQHGEFQSLTLSHSNNLIEQQGIQTPEEILAVAYQTIRTQLSVCLLHQIVSATPVFFERIILDLLLAMGYGGTRKDALSAVRRTAEGGIEGLNVEDKLGLDMMFVQANRWPARLGIPAVRDFVGALFGYRANKGVLITTSYFSDEAREFAESASKKVVLIDGAKLAELLIDYEIGVEVEETFVHKKIDEGYFNDQMA